MPTALGIRRKTPLRIDGEQSLFLCADLVFFKTSVLASVAQTIVAQARISCNLSFIGEAGYS